jgi:hypothetical protein
LSAEDAAPLADNDVLPLMAGCGCLGAPLALLAEKPAADADWGASSALPVDQGGPV